MRVKVGFDGFQARARAFRIDYPESGRIPGIYSITSRADVDEREASI